MSLWNEMEKSKVGTEIYFLVLPTLRWPHFEKNVTLDNSIPGTEIYLSNITWYTLTKSGESDTQPHNTIFI